MFANFTEESCTGTGDTLTLTGASTGAIPFSASFADGDLVSYALEDSGGSIKVAGIGTFNSVGTITRNDTWNYNGTVVDKNPATNIALSAGAHTVRCDVVGKQLSSNTRSSDAALSNSIYHVGDSIINASNTAVAIIDRLSWYPITLTSSALISEIGLSVSSGQAASNTRVGIYEFGSDGNIGELIIDSGLIDTTATGPSTNLVAPALYLPAGKYYMASVSDSAITFQSTSHSAMTAIGGVSNNNSHRAATFYQNVAHTGELPTTLSYDFWFNGTPSVPVVMWR